MKKSSQIDWTEKEISSSALKAAKSSTRDFLWYYDKPKTSASHFDFGNAVELWLIDKPSFHEKVAILDESKRPFPDKNYQTRANKDWKDEFYEANADKYIIPSIGSDSFATCMELEQLAMMHPAYDMLLGKNYQDPFRWTCPVTGLKRYARTDLFDAENGIIIDIKTDGKGDFQKACVNNDYLLQAFDQIIGAVESGKMAEVNEYFWFVLSKEEPYFVDVYKLNIEDTLRVEESYWSTLRRLAADLKGDPSAIVWHEAPITMFKIPGYYK